MSLDQLSPEPPSQTPPPPAPTTILTTPGRPWQPLGGWAGQEGPDPLPCTQPTLPFPAQRLPQPRGPSWRHWSSGCRGTRRPLHRPRPRVTSGRPACTSALSRCLEGRGGGSRELTPVPDAFVPRSNTKTPSGHTELAGRWTWRSCLCPQVVPAPMTQAPPQYASHAPKAQARCPGYEDKCKHVAHRDGSIYAREIHRCSKLVEFFIFHLATLGMEPGASHLLGKRSTPELPRQPAQTFHSEIGLSCLSLLGGWNDRCALLCLAWRVVFGSLPRPENSLQDLCVKSPVEAGGPSERPRSLPDGWEPLRGRAARPPPSGVVLLVPTAPHPPQAFPPSRAWRRPKPPSRVW